MWPLIRLALARVPSAVWIAGAGLALAVTCLATAYQRGQHDARRAIAAAAHHDTTTRAIAAVAIATQRSDASMARAGEQAARTARARVTVRQQRKDVAALLEAAAPPVLQLVDDQGMQITRDSITIAIQASTIDTLLLERVTRQQLDTARVHAQADQPSGDGSSAAGVAKLAAIAIVAWEAGRWALRGIRR